MSRPGKWYRQGFTDGRDGICDPPWYPGHRDNESYRDGFRDAQRELQREADRADQQSEVGNG